jgi:hypothetical protein
MDHVHGIQGKKLVSRDLPSVNKGLGADNGDNDPWTTTPLFDHQLITDIDIFIMPAEYKDDVPTWTRQRD